MRAALLVVGLVIALLFAACGNDSDDANSPTGSGGAGGQPSPTTVPCEIYIPDLVKAKDNQEVLQVRARSEETGCSSTPGFMSCEAYYEAAERATASHAQSIITTLALQVGCPPPEP